MTEWMRPKLTAKTPVRVWIAGGLVGMLVTVSALGALNIATSETTIVPLTLPSPGVAVQTAAPVVVTVPAAPIVVAAPSAPAIVPVRVRPRALTPRIDARCIIGDESAHCSWDDGFPAISADGTLLAAKLVDDDGNRGNRNYAIRFIDTSTSKVVRTMTILDADEYDAEDTKLPARVARRAREAQRALDAGAYRSLEDLTLLDPERYVDHEAERIEPPDHAYAEIQGDALRIIDPAANTVTWQGRVGVPSPFQPNTTEDCVGWSRLVSSAAIDRATGVLHVSHLYRTGGCMCPDVETDVVTKI